MIIAVTGTPCSGKTTICRKLAIKLGPGWTHVELNRLAKQKRLYKGKDARRGCLIVDTAALSRETAKMKGNLLLDAHYSHVLPCDLILAVRCNPGILRTRMMKRGWTPNKIEENVEAEIMEECLREARETGKHVAEIKTGKASEAFDTILKFSCSFRPALKNDVSLPASLRPAMRKPFGKLCRDFGRPAGSAKLVSVGDRVTADLMDAGVRPDLCIIDNMEQRKPRRKLALPGRLVMVKNPAGIITTQLWKAVARAASGRKSAILVEGEEDLAVLPCVLLFPCGTRIVYGLPGKGAVLVRADGKTKFACASLLGRMKG